MAGPESPEYTALPLPATRVRVPEPSTLNTRFPELKYTLPKASAATPTGDARPTLAAAAGVNGTPPPATVEIR